MIDRQSAGLLPDKPHTALRAPDGELLYEEMLTRGGFGGAVLVLLPSLPGRRAPRGRRPPQRGWPAPEPDPEGPSPLRRRLYLSDRVAPGGMLVDRRVPLLFNKDVTVLLARADRDRRRVLRQRRRRRALVRPARAARASSRRAGGSTSRPATTSGSRSRMVHRWHLGEPVRMLVLRGARRACSIPEAFRNPVGQLRMDAPYTHRDFVRPPARSPRRAPLQDGPRELIVKKQGTFTRYTLDTPAMDVVGWDGFVYPCRVRHREVPAEDGPRSPAAAPCTRPSRARASSSARSSRA